MRDDSSSANLPDDAGPDFHNIEARTRGKDVEHLREVVERAAIDINAAVEIVEQF